jgi:hypothetical protein
VDVREYLESLAKSEKLRGEAVDNLKVVFHFSPPELLTEPAYLGRGRTERNVTTKKSPFKRKYGDICELENVKQGWSKS